MNDNKTIEQAVMDEIDAFMRNGCGFSAYTITTNIRNKVNNKMILIDGIPVENINGVYTQKIDHDIVRKCVHYLCNRGVSGYERKWNRLPDDTGYWSWESVKKDDIDNKTTTHGNITIKFGTVAHKNPAADINDPKIIGMICNYIEKHKPVTLRDVQKRMKRNRLTIRQIYDIADREGYCVDFDVKSYSLIR